MPLIEFDYSTSFGSAVGLEHDALVGLSDQLRDLVTNLRADWEAGLLPFLGLPDGNHDRLLKEAEAARAKFDRLVVLGIGGSSLGARAVYEALTGRYSGKATDGSERRRLDFNENVDPDQLADLLDTVDWERTQWAMITKSGSTIETWSAFLVVWERLLSLFGEEGARQRIVIVTDPERGPLRAFASEHSLTSFEVPPGVGGRFSVLTAVGLYPLAFAGIDIPALLKGAARVRDRSLASDVLDNPATVLAGLQYLHYNGGRRTVVLMPYVRALSSFAEWFCQLWGESLGKRRGEERVGPTPVAAIGVRDQHSQLQLYMEGPADKNLVFICPKEFSRTVSVPISKHVAPELGHLGGKDLSEILRAELEGSQQALYEEGCPSALIRLRSVSAASVGGLLLLFEVATALVGGLLEVDPYNQPGVELGKRYAHGLLGRGREAHYAASLDAARGERTRRELAV